MMLLHVFLTLVWVALTGDVSSVNIGVGLVVSYAILWMLSRVSGQTEYFERVSNVAAFVMYFLWQLVKANVEVAFDIITPKHRMHPAVLAVPLDVKGDEAITLLANAVSLTPGSLSLDVSKDHSVLYVHVMYARDREAVRQALKDGLERRIREVQG
jgi:multicomponent Na+:H+ antiporter subunit E